MIMPVLSKAFGFIFGPALVPALVLGLVISVTQHFKARDEGIEIAAKSECNQVWQLLLSKRQQRVAAQELEAANARLKGERDVNMGLYNELEQIRAKHAALESQLATQQPAAADGRSLSDGVWNDLQRRYGVGRGSQGTGESSRGGGSRPN